MKKIIIIGGIVIIGLCAVIIPRVTKKEQFAAPVMAPLMSTDTPEKQDIQLTTSLIGTIEPAEVVYIYPKMSGEVISLNVKSGDYVAAGQEICEIDTKQVETAKNSMDTASVSLKEARDELSRQQILYSGGGLSEQAYQQYKTNVEKAQLQYDAAKIAYENQLEYSSISSPISGTIETLNVEMYDQIGASNMICVVSGEGGKVVSFSVTERIKNYLSQGDTIQVEKDGAEYQGTIYEINSMADSDTGLYKVKASLEGAENLSTGSTAKLSVISEKTENAMTVPVNAVYFDGGESYIYTYDNGTVHKILVETGIYDSESIEVLSGITMEDQIITTWSSELYDGASVRLADESHNDLSMAEEPVNELTGGQSQTAE